MTNLDFAQLDTRQLANVSGGANSPAGARTFEQRYTEWEKLTAGKSPADLLRLPPVPTR